jgi:lysylphosphatidylglycerol synthetase-like protein (DUF2156 family)
MKNKKDVFLLYFRLFAVSISLFAMSNRLIVEPLLGDGFPQFLDMLGYFTIQSGLLVLAVFISLLVNQLRGTPEKAFSPKVRGAVLLYIIITSLIFMVLLNGTFETHGLNKIVLYINHLGTAVLLMIDNIISIRPRTYKWPLLFWWLIYPIVYLIFAIIEGVFFDRFRYYFLNFNELGFGYFIRVVLLLVLVFVVIGSFIIFINKVFRPKPE